VERLAKAHFEEDVLTGEIGQIGVVFFDQLGEGGFATRRTNAVRHGGSRRGGSLELVRSQAGAWERVGVGTRGESDKIRFGVMQFIRLREGRNAKLLGETRLRWPELTRVVGDTF
jgi:hypothetical protein